MIQFGSLEVDLFASHLNCQVPRFFTQYLHLRAEAIDALTSPWPQGILSTHSASTMGPQLSQSSEVIVDIGRSIVASQTLVLRKSTSGSASTASTSSISGPGLSSASRQVAFDRLAVERGQLLGLGLSSEVVNILLASRRSSTLWIYNGTWKVFHRWKSPSTRCGLLMTPS